MANLLDAHGRWDINLLNTFFMPADVHVIRSIRISPSRADNFIAWFPGKHGLFSVKSAYYLAMQDHIQNHNAYLCLEGRSGRIPTNACKVRRHIGVSAQCNLCGAGRVSASGVKGKVYSWH